MLNIKQYRQVKKKKRSYWYMHNIRCCVLCWREEKWKERQYSKKPKDGCKRYNYEEFACHRHFM